VFTGARYATGLLAQILHNDLIKHTILAKIKIIQKYEEIIVLIKITSIIDRLKVIQKSYLFVVVVLDPRPPRLKTLFSTCQKEKKIICNKQRGVCSDNDLKPIHARFHPSQTLSKKGA
jgi:hypothetical protein